MDWGVKSKESLKNKTLKKKPFQGLRNWYSNTKSSIKNYFAKKKANKEGRPFHPTMKAKEARERMERYGVGKRHSQGAFLSEKLPELTPKNVNEVREVNTEAFGPLQVGNVGYTNSEIPLKNSLKSAKEHLRVARRHLREIEGFQIRLSERLYYNEKQLLVQLNEGMLKEAFEGAETHLEEALQEASKVQKKEKAPNFEKREATELIEQIKALETKRKKDYEELDRIYEYPAKYARDNLERAKVFMEETGLPKNVPKAVQRLRASRNNARDSGQIVKNTVLIGNHGQLYADVKKRYNERQARGRGSRVRTMQRGSRGGATRRRRH